MTLTYFSRSQINNHIIVPDKTHNHVKFERDILDGCRVAAVMSSKMAASDLDLLLRSHIINHMIVLGELYNHDKFESDILNGCRVAAVIGSKMAASDLDLLLKVTNYYSYGST